MNREEFDALVNIIDNPEALEHDIPDSLVQAGLVVHGHITEDGIEALRPYAVDNAVIMAAGLSSRFAPISYERPKGLIRVHGEVLIERQIKQLLEASVADITVVVGYKKECFFYLEQKYGVNIVINPEYATKNNHSSLWCVRERLGNTYICSSDDWFDENPFKHYAWRGYYAAQKTDGPTNEWCLTVDEDDRIAGVQVGGENAWYMIGHAYFDRTFSERFRSILEQEYPLPRTAGKLWEDIYAEHLDELDLRIRRYEPPIIREFDSLDELREFDPLFLENIDIDILDNIEATLGCRRSEIRDVYPLKQGLTNLSCHFRTDTGEYVYRHPGIGSEQLVDRAAEKEALLAAQSLGLDKTLVYADPHKGWKISRFIDGARNPDVSDDDELLRAMEIVRKLHASGAQVPRTFDFYHVGKSYESKLLAHKLTLPSDYGEMAAKAAHVHQLFLNDQAPICLCHNDFFSLNLLIDPKGDWSLIDWEYAGMSDYANDLGTFCVCEQLSPERVDRAIEFYFGRKPTNEELRHNYAAIGLAGWCWYVWALLKEADGDQIDEWLYIYYRYAREYLDKALRMRHV